MVGGTQKPHGEERATVAAEPRRPYWDDDCLSRHTDASCAVSRHITNMPEDTISGTLSPADTGQGSWKLKHHLRYGDLPPLEEI